MLDHIRLENLICLDIETAPEFENLSQLPDQLQPLYLRKSERLKQEGENEGDQYFNHAGIYAEFGKVICITLGIFKKEGDNFQLRLKSVYGDDEKKLLEDFCDILLKYFPRWHRYQFCGHNIREFDIPYLCRRLLIHHFELPRMLDFSGMKPWEISMIDTLQLWRFGDIKHFTSLKLLSLILGIDSPKDDIEGKDVARVYWKEKNLNRIVEYCQRDVTTVAQLILRFKGMPLLSREQIVVTATQTKD